MSKGPVKPLFVKVPYNPTADLPQQCEQCVLLSGRSHVGSYPFFVLQSTFPSEGSDLWGVEHHWPAFADQVTSNAWASERPNTSRKEYRCSTNRKRGYNLGKKVFNSLLLSITFSCLNNDCVFCKANIVVITGWNRKRNRLFFFLP